jgi:16S rRNA (cytosine1407-C5)-methyltransferase
MIPIKEIEKKINPDALDILRETFTAAQFNELLLSFRIKRHTTFRVNLLKADKNSIIKEMQNNGFKVKMFDLINNAFIYEGKNNHLLKSKFVSEGLIYLQSLSSMIPPILLDPKEGDKILDVASAPGSKVTQIADLTKNNSTIDAIEPDYIRMERLKYNINLLGANVNLYKSTFQNFCKIHNEPYDKILADLPCSGEGRFNIYDKPSYSLWCKNNIPRLARLQKDILKKAISLLKIGGTIVYSTCTLNYYENEEVVDEILKDEEFKIEIIDISQKLKDIKEAIKPITEIEGKLFDKSINKSLRIMPSERFEGFFICKMKRVK